MVKNEAMECCSAREGVKKGCFSKNGIFTESNPPELVFFFDHSSMPKKEAYRSFRVFFRGFLWHIPNCIMLYINTLKHVAISR